MPLQIYEWTSPSTPHKLTQLQYNRVQHSNQCYTIQCNIQYDRVQYSAPQCKDSARRSTVTIIPVIHLPQGNYQHIQLGISTQECHLDTISHQPQLTLNLWQWGTNINNRSFFYQVFMTAKEETNISTFTPLPPVSQIQVTTLMILRGTKEPPKQTIWKIITSLNYYPYIQED